MSGDPSGKLLVVAPCRWDEAAFSMPAVRALAAPGLQLCVLHRDSQSQLWQTLPNVSSCAYPDHAGAREISRIVLAQGSWQAAIAWEFEAAATAVKKAGVRDRIGPNHRSMKRWVTQAIALDEDSRAHRVRFYLSTAEAMGVTSMRAEWFEPADLGVLVGPRSALLCPDSDFGANHEWPIDSWHELAKALIGEGWKLTIGATTSGRGLAADLANHLGEAVPSVSVERLSAVLPLLASFERVVAADGSLPHLAAYAGATCLTLFGPNDAEWKRPLGKQHRVARRAVECAPCLLASCPLDLRCQFELLPAHVLKQFRSLTPP